MYSRFPNMHTCMQQEIYIFPRAKSAYSAEDMTFSECIEKRISVPLSLGNLGRMTRSKNRGKKIKTLKKMNILTKHYASLDRKIHRTPSFMQLRKIFRGSKIGKCLVGNMPIQEMKLGKGTKYFLHVSSYLRYSGSQRLQNLNRIPFFLLF